MAGPELAGEAAGLIERGRAGGSQAEDGVGVDGLDPAHAVEPGREEVDEPLAEVRDLGAAPDGERHHGHG